MNLKNPQIIWATVAIVFMLIGGAVALTAMDKDPNIILVLAGIVAVPVLTGFGAIIYQKVDQTKEIANGNQSRMLTQLLQAHRESIELAKQVPTATEANGDNSP